MLRRQQNRETGDADSNNGRKLSVYRYDGVDTMNDDNVSMDGADRIGNRDRQVTYYVNKDAMRDMDDGSDEDYGRERKGKHYDDSDY